MPAFEKYHFNGDKQKFKNELLYIINDVVLCLVRTYMPLTNFAQYQMYSVKFNVFFKYWYEFPLVLFLFVLRMLALAPCVIVYTKNYHFCFLI